MIVIVCVHVAPQLCLCVLRVHGCECVCVSGCERMRTCLNVGCMYRYV